MSNNRKNFAERVYEAVKQIPRGKIATYSEVARAIGSPRAARAVGNVLRRNPRPISIPCHRVIRSDGSIGGYAKGAHTKIRLLRNEKITITNNRINLKQFGYFFV